MTELKPYDGSNTWTQEAATDLDTTPEVIQDVVNALKPGRGVPDDEKADLLEVAIDHHHEVCDTEETDLYLYFDVNGSNHFHLTYEHPSTISVAAPKPDNLEAVEATFEDRGIQTEQMTERHLLAHLNTRLSTEVATELLTHLLDEHFDKSPADLTNVEHVSDTSSYSWVDTPLTAFSEVDSFHAWLETNTPHVDFGRTLLRELAIAIDSTLADRTNAEVETHLTQHMNAQWNQFGMDDYTPGEDDLPLLVFSHTDDDAMVIVSAITPYVTNATPTQLAAVESLADEFGTSPYEANHGLGIELIEDSETSIRLVQRLLTDALDWDLNDVCLEERAREQ